MGVGAAAAICRRRDLLPTLVLERSPRLILLRRPQPLVEPSGAAKQLAVRSALDEAASVEHENLLRAGDGGEAMRHDELGAPRAEPLVWRSIASYPFSHEPHERYACDSLEQ